MARWSWLLICFALAVFASLLPREAQAHPLGNFTINHYSRLEFTDEKAHLDYVLDFAEIPTFQQKGKLDPTATESSPKRRPAPTWMPGCLPSLKNLDLQVGNEELPLRVLDQFGRLRAGPGRAAGSPRRGQTCWPTFRKAGKKTAQAITPTATTGIIWAGVRSS